MWRKSSHSEGTNDSDCVEIGRWRKSSYSEANGNSECVEIGRGADVIAVRDSKRPAAGMLTFASTTWRTFQTMITD
ncbi:DUF397 domain-containing protein [Actinophytocola sp.]|uniref:DUF397 domain-containing protein n=1 Tax=Actinophytocola sp. TaxID=1872138 RepID=UPI003D6A4C0B